MNGRIRSIVVAATALGALVLSACGPARPKEEPMVRQARVCLPGELDSWQRERLDFFDAEALAGAGESQADVLRHMDFKVLALATYRDPDGETADVRFYAMGNAPDAWGVFSLKRQQGKPVFIGQKAAAGQGYVVFWKGRFCVQVAAAPDRPAAQEKLADLARGIEARIYETGDGPALLDRFPSGVFDSTAVYFHAGRRIGDLPERFTVPGGLLDLSGRQTNVLDLSPGRGAATAAVIRYPSPQAASDVVAKISAAVGRTQMQEPVSKGELFAWVFENGRYLACVRDGAYLTLGYGDGSIEEVVNRVKTLSGLE
jgi:hypothetical protein